MNNMNTAACMSNTDIKDAYRALIASILKANNVNTIAAISGEKCSPYFTAVKVLSDGSLEVHKNGLEFSNFYYDYTCDFAHCLAVIEDEVYVQYRNGKPQHGYKVTFKSNR